MPGAVNDGHAALLAWGLKMKHATLRCQKYEPVSAVLAPVAERAVTGLGKSVERCARHEAAWEHAVALHTLTHAVCVMPRRAEAAAKRVALGKPMRAVVWRETRAEALRVWAVKVKRRQLMRANRREV